MTPDSAGFGRNTLGRFKSEEVICFLKEDIRVIRVICGSLLKLTQ